MRRTTQQLACVSPDRLHFLVTINNKMPRVFRGAGAVVQFNVEGRLQAVDQSGYSNFQGLIIPPEQQQQVELIGPPLSALKQNKGIAGIFLYDVVTNQNEAGVVTEKQNFKWLFEYIKEPQQRQVQTTTEELWMSPAEFQQAIFQQQQQRTAEMLRANGVPPQALPPMMMPPQQ